MKRFTLVILFCVAGTAVNSPATQRTVLGELFTNWDNAGCLPANEELDGFAPLHPNLALIRYHTWWPGATDPFYLENTTENTVRTDYYQPGSKSVPRFFADGLVDGGSEYWTWENLVMVRELVASPLAMSVDGSYDPGTRSGSTHVRIEVIDLMGPYDPTLHFVITESNIPLSAPNGQTVFHQVMRDMLPDAYGETVVLTDPSQVLERYRLFTLGGSWVVDNCEMIVFIQDELTKEVLQAAKWRMSGSIHDVGTQSLTGPSDNVLPGTFDSPSAWIHNYGDFSEVFRVWCRITPGAYLDHTDVMLNPGGSIHLTFADWFVPPTDSIVYEMCVYTVLDVDMVQSNDTLCKLILAADPSAHDVGTDSIVDLPDTVWADSVYSFGAWIHNYGDYWELFDVECIINPGGYVDTFEAAFAAPGGDYECTFGPWTVPSGGAASYTVCVQTLLPGDTDPSNDSLCTEVVVRGSEAHDVGIESISSPPGSVLPGSSHPPSAWIRNYGGYTEGFDAECVITPSGYADTATVTNLSPGSNVECVFSDWAVPPDDSTTYTLTVKCLLATDTNPANDTMSKQVFAFYADINDVGVCGISVPPDTVEVGVTYNPSICVENLGAYNQTFWTFCRIDESGNPVYLDSIRVNNLHPGQQRQAGLGGWTVTPPPGTIYDVCAWVEPLLDQNPSNDSLCKTTYSIVGVEEILARRGQRHPMLLQNLPNPFARSTVIAFELAEQGMVSLSIYDAAGSIVTVLLDEKMPSGPHQVLWDGRNDDGRIMPEGVYFCKFSLRDLEATRKLVFIK